MAERGQEGDGTRYQLRDHERRIERLERYEPAVMTRKLDELEKTAEEIRDGQKWQTRALVGALLTMLTAIAVVLLALPHG